MLCVLVIKALDIVADFANQIELQNIEKIATPKLYYLILIISG